MGVCKRLGGIEMGKRPQINNTFIGIIIAIMVVVSIVGGFVVTRGYNLRMDVTYPSTVVDKPAMIVQIFEKSGHKDYTVKFNVLDSQTTKTLTFDDGKPNIFGQIDIYVIPPVATWWHYRIDVINDKITFNVGTNRECMIFDNNDQHVATINFVWEIV
jgi:hypothetical protein